MVQRTQSQNNALHLYLSRVADELNKEGRTMQDVMRAVKRAEIRPTMEGLKEVVWKPMQEIMLAKKSTTELTKQEVDEVFEMFNAFMGREFGIHIPFPHDPDKIPNSPTYRDTIVENETHSTEKGW